MLLGLRKLILIFLYLINSRLILCCENTTPKNPADCHKFHDSEKACCYLKYFEGYDYKLFKTKCIEIEPGKARTGAYYPEVETLDPQNYNKRIPQIINCGNYETKNQTSCGDPYPSRAADCTKYSYMDTDCCLQIIDYGLTKYKCVASGLTNKQDYSYSINGNRVYVFCSDNSSVYLNTGINSIVLFVFFILFYYI
jgi:hypothetical protein